MLMHWNIIIIKMISTSTISVTGCVNDCGKSSPFLTGDYAINVTIIPFTRRDLRIIIQTMRHRKQDNAGVLLLTGYYGSTNVLFLTETTIEYSLSS